MTFTPIQKKIVDAFKKDHNLAEQFYFTGGTALSVFYLHHRESEDLDFFIEENLPKEQVLAFMSDVSKQFDLQTTIRQPKRADILIFSLISPKGEKLKVDFNHYHYKRIKPGQMIDGLEVDSLQDIATNKLLTINQRNDVKDFVDLYFLLKEFTIWDLLYGVEAKFGMELDRLMIATDFLKVEEFDFLPKMLVPLDIKILQDFFKERAIEIGKQVTE